MAEDPVKISANLPQSTFEQLRWIASERGTTMTEVLRRAIEHEAFITDITANKGRILTEDSSGKLREVVIK